MVGDINNETMRYLIIDISGHVFYTSRFDIENHYVPGMIVVDTQTRTVYDGDGWKLIEIDRL